MSYQDTPEYVPLCPACIIVEVKAGNIDSFPESLWYPNGSEDIGLCEEHAKLNIHEQYKQAKEITEPFLRKIV